MSDSFKKENRRKRVNKLAQEFMCAMLSDGRWWTCHTAEPKAAIYKAFVFAEAFCDEEDRRSNHESKSR